MEYQVEYTKEALKILKKMDKHNALILTSWIEKNLVNTLDPYRLGKSLVGNKKGQWRYRVGNHRILTKIDDGKLLILILEIGHRKDIYN